MKQLAVVLLLVMLVLIAMDFVAPQQASAGMAAGDAPDAVLKYQPASKGKVAFGLTMFIAGILTVKYL
jgi:hypothetical protein